MAQQQGTAEYLAGPAASSHEAQAQFMEKQGPALARKPAEAQSLVQINSIEWKKPKDPKSLDHLMLQKILEGFYQKYLREKMRKDEELTAYLALHDIELQSIIIQGTLFTQADPIVQSIKITRLSAH